MIGFIEPLPVFDPWRMQGREEGMLRVEILLVKRDPVLYPIAESLIERNAILVKVSNDLTRFPGPILVHQGLGNIPVIKR